MYSWFLSQTKPNRVIRALIEQLICMSMSCHKSFSFFCHGPINKLEKYLYKQVLKTTARLSKLQFPHTSLQGIHYSSVTLASCMIIFLG